MTGDRSRVRTAPRAGSRYGRDAARSSAEDRGHAELARGRRQLFDGPVDDARETLLLAASLLAAGAPDGAEAARLCAADAAWASGDVTACLTALDDTDPPGPAGSHATPDTAPAGEPAHDRSDPTTAGGGTGPTSGVYGDAPVSALDGDALAPGLSGSAPATGGAGGTPASGPDGDAPVSGLGGDAAVSGLGGDAPRAGGGGGAPVSGLGGDAPVSGVEGGVAASGLGGSAPMTGGVGGIAVSGPDRRASVSGLGGSVPATGGNGSAPASGLGGSAPTFGLGGDASASGRDGSAPTTGGVGGIPVSGPDGDALASGLDRSVPATGGNGSAPASGLGGSAPVSGLGGSAPASGLGGSAPMSGLGGDAPASGLGGSAPTSGLGGDAPASGPGGSAPTTGGVGGTLVSGPDRRASVSGMGGSTPMSGLGGDAPASGLGGSAPTSGLGGDAPASGRDGSAPTTGGVGGIPVSGPDGDALASGLDRSVQTTGGNGSAPASGPGGSAPASGPDGHPSATDRADGGSPSPAAAGLTVPPVGTGRPELRGSGWGRDQDPFFRDYRDGMRALLVRRPELAAGPLRRVLSRVRHDDPPERLLRAASAALLLGDVHAARAAGARALAVARNAECVASEARALEYLAYGELRAGRHAQARAHAEEGVRAALLAGHRNTAASHHALLALAASIEGDTAAVAGYASAALATARRHGLAQAATLAEWATARADLARGRPLDAADRLGPLVGPGPRRGHFAVWMLAVPCFVEAAVLAGQPEDAREPVVDLARWADFGADPHASAQLARCRALLAADDREADDLYLRALALHDGSGGDFERARTELLYGRWLRRRRRLREARGRLGAALVAFEHCGAGAWADQTRGELRANGAASGKEPAAGLARLTPQQLRIARHVAEGATNREVAQRLAVSTRTVDYHLRNVFAALGVRSRVELARMVDQEHR
ncbi:LuxR C-terminal-related transcriptional regulator [Streptomyces iakyrus]|uniref:LuxR C-terminal-related transcriptional regulator n=1 Tax=Streptomyces iakyrus TaxID=68219 RepID=A0ABW8FLS9_9ACTN